MAEQGNTNHATSPELLPCPFCGSADIVTDRDGPEFPLSVVFCWQCGATMDDDTDCTSAETPFDRWQTRQHQSPSTSLSDETCIVRHKKHGTVICGRNIVEQYLRSGYAFDWAATDKARDLPAMRAADTSPADEVERAANDFAVKVTEYAIMELDADEENTAQIEAFGALVEREFRAALSAIRNGDEGMREALEQIKFAGEHPKAFKSDRQMWEVMADIARAAIAEDTQ